MTKTRKNRLPWSGWSKEKPSRLERTLMLKRCGKKCFLGTKKSFPICRKKTCKISKKGVYSAYIRARQYRNKGSKYYRIANEAKKKLNNI